MLLAVAVENTRTLVGLLDGILPDVTVVGHAAREGLTT